MKTRILFSLVAFGALTSMSYAQIGNNPNNRAGSRIGENPNRQQLERNLPTATDVNPAARQAAVPTREASFSTTTTPIAPGSSVANPNTSDITSAALSDGLVDPGTGYNGYYGSYGDHGYSPAAVMRAAAEGLRGAGSYNVRTAVAASVYEDARAKNIENAKRYVEVYFERKQINKENTLDKIVRLNPDQYARIAKEAAPRRLTSYQLNPVSGSINWPATLQADSFAGFRADLNRLFADRDTSSGLGSDNQKTTALVAAEMQAELKAQVGSLSADEYLVAKRFIDSLAYEAKFVPGIEGVAKK